MRFERRRWLLALSDRRVDVVHHRCRVGAHEVRDLRGVDARATADGDKAIDLMLEGEVRGVLK